VMIHEISEEKLNSDGGLNSYNYSRFLTVVAASRFDTTHQTFSQEQKYTANDIRARDPACEKLHI
jgi:hypothetical protein